MSSAAVHATPEGEPGTRAALLLTDIVDSAGIAEQLGDVAAAVLWSAHDRVARDLLRTWRGREIDKSDGFLLLFADAADALGYALAYHRALATLPTPLPVPVRARAGLHVGQITVRENSAEDVTLGAKPLEVDGVTKPVAARVMSTALGGQTLLTTAALEALGRCALKVVSHGFWRIKGLADPIELHEVGEPGAPFTPPPDGDKVYRVVRAGEHWQPARETRHSLPAERDSFVGQRATLLEIAQRFDGGARLVSLLGIGGSGKTRVAARFGRVWLGDFPGGAWFCDLAAARTFEGLLSAVAVGLDVPLRDGDPVEQLGHAIAGRGAALLILDNFEQVARHAEAAVGRWLERAPQVRVLVTSREVLGIAGEQVIGLAPMKPDDAETLFLVRAAAARGDFHPGADDRAAIGTLVELLDGLPLAIELAAARIRTLSPRALLGRMSERFRLLASSGGRMDRQATLRATFDWSWDLLSPAEKAALAQLSVFQGGFAVEAAEAVVDLAGCAGAPWVVDVVQSLLDKSFVRTLPRERFGLLGSVQAYAIEHLATAGRYPGSGPEALRAAQTRHAEWFAALGPRGALKDACADLDNLVVACRFASTARMAEVAAAALDGAWAALSLRGPFKAGLDLAEAVCALPQLPPRAGAIAFGVRGNALRTLGRRAEAGAHVETAMRHAEDSRDAAVAARARIDLAFLAQVQGRSDEARSGFVHAIAMAEAAGETELRVRGYNQLGNLDLQSGRIQEAETGYDIGLGLARAQGDRFWQCALVSNLGNVHAAAGRFALARACYEEGLALAREQGDRQREGNTLCNLAMVQTMQGHLEAAAASGEAALAVARDLGYVDLEVVVTCNLGLVHEAAGRVDAARTCFDDALRAARQTGDQRSEGQVLGYLGRVRARQGDFVAAQACFTDGYALLQALDDVLSLAVLVCARTEAELMAGAREAALASREEARALTARAGAGPDSEPGQALARLDALLTTAA